jgi:hypothetical protein
VAIKGRFQPRNPDKYRGDTTQIIFRSSWEVKMMRRLDTDPNVVEWSSESVIVPYSDRSTGRFRRYYPDFWMRRKDGAEFLIEVKPLKETMPPKREGKTEKRYVQECITYAKNISKWEAAEKFCEKRNWRFLKITERELGIR